jgi:uncharacterized protein YjbI with pentapeptide repeats
VSENHKWQRDPAFNYDRFNPPDTEVIDQEIERLQAKPGYLERLLNRITGGRKRADEQLSFEPVSYAEQSLSRANFTRKMLIRADFRGCSLDRSNFTGAVLEGALFCDSDLRDANLAEAVLIGADFRGADLSGANLIGADFSAADLRGANLQGAYLWGADFHDADLLNTMLDGAYAGGSIFSHARNLTLEQFRSTIHDETGAYRLSMLPDPHSDEPGR